MSSQFNHFRAMTHVEALRQTAERQRRAEEAPQQESPYPTVLRSRRPRRPLSLIGPRGVR
jgi:hypothetical protein